MREVIPVWAIRFASGGKRGGWRAFVFILALFPLGQMGVCAQGIPHLVPHRSGGVTWPSVGSLASPVLLSSPSAGSGGETASSPASQKGSDGILPERMAGLWIGGTATLLGVATLFLVRINRRLRAEAVVRLAAEADLQIRESLLAQTLESLPDAAFLVEEGPGKEFVLAFQNEQFLSLMEIRREECQGRPLTMFLPPGASELLHRIGETVRTRCPAHFEAPLSTSAGIQLLEVRLAPVFSLGGRGTYVVGLARDVTGQRLMESQLRESEDRHRAIVRACPDGILITRGGGAIHMASPSAVRMLGATSEQDLLGRNIQDFLDPDDWPRGRKLAMAALMGRLSSGGVFSIRRLDGSSFSGEFKGDHLLDPSGHLAGVVLVLRDISEHTALEEALRGNEARFRTLVELVPIPMVLSRVADGEILFANNRAKELFRFHMEIQRGLYVIDLYREPTMRSHFIEEVKKKGYVTDYEIALRKSDGSPFSALLYSILMDYQGEPAIISGISDITERKNAENRLRQALEDTERLNRAMAGREDRIIELKQEVNGLLEEQGRPPRYSSLV